MDFNDVLNIKYMLLIPLMLLGGMNSRSLAVVLVATLGVLNAQTLEQYEIIFFGFVLGYFLSNFRE